MLPLFKFGLGGRFGYGRQWMSWIALDDEVDAIVHLLGSDVAGPVNLTAPTPVRNRELADTIGDVLHRPTRAAGPGVRPEARCSAASAPPPCSSRASGCCRRVLQADGFEWRFPTLEPLRRPRR